ncbi:MAG TPA: hypothetical protein VMM79_18445 [Longimicrobiales bacterium]|nr:hypothetical protein [Longimicrobiales bacterium]
MLFGSGTAFPGAAAIVPVGGTALMLTAGAINQTAGPFRWLVNRPMLWIGRLSYSWYLWHWPILIFAAAFPPLRGTTAGVVLSVGSLGLAKRTATDRGATRAVGAADHPGYVHQNEVGST